MLKFFRLPFGTTGDKTAVPDAVDVNGNVSYSQGYGFDYQRQKTDPAAKNIERDKMNQILFDITTAIAELQAQGVPDFITSALNGGTAYSYGQYAVVKYSGDLYISLVATNTALPSDATKWALLPTPARVRDGANTVAASGGTADAITLTLTPTQTAFAPGPTWWRATAANTSATPTVQRDGLAAKTLVKGNNLPLLAGDIPGAGAWMVSQYDAALDKEVLLNPALLASAGGFTGTGTGFTVAPTATISYKIIGGVVHLNIPLLAFTGTSNANTFSITGMPAEIRPAATRYLQIAPVTDNSLASWGDVEITTAGVINLYRLGSSANWATSGTKALRMTDCAYKL